MRYRVDVFGESHMKNYFEKEEEAREFANKACKYANVFLLKETASPGIYDVVELIVEKV